MKCKGFTLVGLVVGGMLLITACTAPTPTLAPTLRGPVNDDAKILTAEQVQSLSADLNKQEKETGNQIVILTIPTLSGKDISQFAIDTAKSWKLGKKDKDNGVLFVIAVKEHKTWITVGRGLEGVLTDAKCRRILADQVKPQFKAGNYFGGIQAAINAIDNIIHGRAEGAAGAAAAGVAGAAAAGFWGTSWGIALIVIICIVVLIILLTVAANSDSLGSGLGGFFGSDSSSSSGSSGGGGFSGGGGDFGGGGAGGGW